MCQSGPPAWADETAKVLTLVWLFVNMARVGHSDVVRFRYYRVRPSTSCVANIAEMGRATSQSNVDLADLCAWRRDIYQECRHLVSLQVLREMQYSFGKNSPSWCSYWFLRQDYGLFFSVGNSSLAVSPPAIGNIKQLGIWLVRLLRTAIFAQKAHDAAAEPREGGILVVD